MQPVKEMHVDENGLKRWFKCTHYPNHAGKGPTDPAKYHYHEYLEFIYILNGSANVIVNDEENHISQGELIIIPPNHNHIAMFSRPVEFIVLIFPLDILYPVERIPFDGKHIKKFLNSDTPYIFKTVDITTIDVGNLILKISEEFHKKKYLYEMLLSSYITELFVTLIRYHSKTESENAEHEYPEMINEIIAYMRKNYDTVTAESVASKFGISYNYFSHIFKKHTGISFIEYLTKIRLVEAKKSLITTKKSITEIATDMGFSTTSHFIMLFKKHNGITPNKFRSSIRTQNINL